MDRFERQLIKLKRYSILFQNLLSFSVPRYLTYLSENERFNSNSITRRPLFSSKICDMLQKMSSK